MRRANSVATIGATAASLVILNVIPSLAQTPGRVYRLGHLGNAAVSETYSRQQILPELTKLGFIEGRNLVFVGRIGEPDALRGLMHEILSAQPDAVIAIGPTAVVAAGAATSTVPIVALMPDPIELGLAKSFARPGGNVTGVALLARELEIKRLSILHEAVPDRRRIAVLVPSAGKMFSETEMRTAATSLGVELLTFNAAAPADYPAAFTAMREAGAQALLISATPLFQRDAQQLAALALEAKLPTVCEWADMAQSGCLIGYGPNRPEMRRRMAHQIAAILRGDAPGNIPIEQSMTFEFAINLKTAKSIGVELPTAVLTIANQVIE